MHREKDLFSRFSLGLEPGLPAKFAAATLLYRSGRARTSLVRIS
jgi:hypothetical protein